MSWFSKQVKVFKRRWLGSTWNDATALWNDPTVKWNEINVGDWNSKNNSGWYTK